MLSPILEPVLFPMIHALHGNFGLPSDWDAALPPEIPAKAWHLWNIRRHHPETYTLTGFATWFNNQIAALPPDPNRILAGYSLGGRLALHVLVDRPALWHRALIISAHPGLTTDAERPARRAQDALWKGRCLTRPWPEVCAAWNAQSLLHSTATLPDLSAFQPWSPEIAGAFDGWSLGRQENLLIRYSPLPCRGLWLAGGNDDKFSSIARAAVEALPGFSLQLIPKSGHRLLRDQPAAIQSAIWGLLV